ncbi:MULTISPECIES: hypothetical protein [Pseudomonas]|uniref:hypothetical protein n=1 Tax=Pseudomonas TaxID=286 RepID=UPI000B164FBB|nr:MULTISPECIES: hypothetical protein [Pseudomonas]QXE10506.1 hypothetical protein GTQ41_16040 [Pseudomonas sp. AN-B15]
MSIKKSQNGDCKHTEATKSSTPLTQLTFFAKKSWPWILIFFFTVSISAAYISNFHNHSLSSDPSDWGALGDYFGGLVNPLASTIALYFLIKAYLSQKEELSETKDALKESAEQNKISAEAQRELAELQKKQISLNEKSIKSQYYYSKIESKHKEISFLYEEIERCTTAKNSDRYTFDSSGNRLYTNPDIDNYRSKMYSKVSRTLKEIAEINALLAQDNE